MALAQVSRLVALVVCRAEARSGDWGMVVRLLHRLALGVLALGHGVATSTVWGRGRGPAVRPRGHRIELEVVALVSRVRHGS